MGDRALAGLLSLYDWNVSVEDRLFSSRYACCMYLRSNSVISIGFAK